MLAGAWGPGCCAQPGTPHDACHNSPAGSPRSLSLFSPFSFLFFPLSLPSPFSLSLFDADQHIGDG